MSRTAEIARDTKETQIRVRVDLDGAGRATVATGIGFFDHMLDSFARHAGFDLEVETKGDLHIDMHHTVEDTGIVIGQAVNRALDGFKGIRRFGLAYIPMDETLTRCAVDFSNRPYLVWRVKFARPTVGEMDTELFKEFHHAFAMHAGTRTTSPRAASRPWLAPCARRSRSTPRRLARRRPPRASSKGIQVPCGAWL